MKRDWEKHDTVDQEVTHRWLFARGRLWFKIVFNQFFSFFFYSVYTLLCVLYFVLYSIINKIIIQLCILSLRVTNISTAPLPLHENRSWIRARGVLVTFPFFFFSNKTQTLCPAIVVFVVVRYFFFLPLLYTMYSLCMQWCNPGTERKKTKRFLTSKRVELYAYKILLVDTVWV